MKIVYSGYSAEERFVLLSVVYLGTILALLGFVFLFLFSVLDRFLHATKRSSEFPLPRTLINYTNKY